MTALTEGAEDAHLFHALRRHVVSNGGEKSAARLLVHRVAAFGIDMPVALRAAISRSTYSRRMCMKSCALVTTPNAWCVPRSLSLLTTNSEESTQIVGSSRSDPSGSVTNAGSMFPVAIACSAVAMRMAMVARMA